MSALETTRVREAILLGAGQVRLVLEPPAGHLDAHTRAGQYCELRIPGSEGAPFALMSTPAERTLAFLIGDRNEPGKSIATLRAGDPVEVSMPSGPGFDLDACLGRDVTFVATGTGIAPVRAALTVALESASELDRIRLYYGLRSRRFVAIDDELPGWIEKGVTVRFHFSESEEGYVQDVVIADRPDPAHTAFITAGHPEVGEALRAYAGSAGVVIENL